MSEGATWTFRQLAGGRKTFTLAGWAAPHGRPRQGPVVRTPLKQRIERVRYPGGDSVTRHQFGTQHEDWELKGRFRDRALGGTGAARAKVQELLAFAGDAQAVEIAWGAFLAFEGFIAEFDPGYESAGEVEWVLRIQIDKDLTQSRPVAPPPPAAPPTVAAGIFAAFAAVSILVLEPPLPGDLFAVISALLSVLSSSVSVLLGATEAVPSYDEATFGDLGTLVGAVARVRRAGVSLREVFAAVPADGVVLAARAEDTIRLLRAQAQAEAQMRALLAACAQMERAAERARAERIKSLFSAALGETWEGLSSRVYGAPDRATDLREANRVPPGQGPIAGVQYVIPK